jgi:hypothetical protein
MKRMICILILAALFASCSGRKEPAPGSPAAALKILASASDYQSALGCYTSATGSAVKRILSAEGMSERDIFPILAFLRGARSWDVLKETIEGDTASLEIVISDHVTDNMKGGRMLCSMQKEDGGWKIDMEKEMRALEKSLRKNNSGGYLERKLKAYQ